MDKKFLHILIIYNNLIYIIHKIFNNINYYNKTIIIKILIKLVTIILIDHLKN